MLPPLYSTIGPPASADRLLRSGDDGAGHAVLEAPVGFSQLGFTKCSRTLLERPCGVGPLRCCNGIENAHVAKLNLWRGHSSDMKSRLSARRVGVFCF